MENSLSWEFITKLLVFVSIPVGVGSALGSVPFYVLAYFGGRPAITKFQKYLRFNWSDVEKVSSRFKGEWYDEILFLLLRSIPLLPSLPVNIAAGVLRMNLLPYLVLSIVGFTIRMMLTLLVVALGMEGLSNFLVLLYTT